ncbi:MAG: hypothetical protein ACXVXP_01360, partial [Mycobacteriaceae bacterium]
SAQCSCVAPAALGAALALDAKPSTKRRARRRAALPTGGGRLAQRARELVLEHGADGCYQDRPTWHKALFTRRPRRRASWH